MPAFSGLFDGVYGVPYTPLGNSRYKEDTYVQLARLLARKNYGNGAIRELMFTLLGSAVGGTATARHFRRVAVVDPLGSLYGGRAAIEQFTSINRVTTTGDRDRFQAAIRQISSPAVYPVDRSGNGGGGKINS